MKDPTELINNIGYRILEAKGTDHPGWSWRDGIKLFLPPAEARCPNCQDFVSTNRVWLVDETNNKLKGCWNLDGSPVDSQKFIIHPHVYDGGEICMGSNKRPSESLFTGLSAGIHYQSTEAWFWMIGHICPKVLHNQCLHCNQFHPGSRLVIYIGSTNERQNLCTNLREYRCGECGGWFIEDEMASLEEERCRSCDEGTAFSCSCDNCECDNNVNTEGHRCESCLDECREVEIFYCACESCDNNCVNEVDDEGRLCNRCSHHDDLEF